MEKLSIIGNATPEIGVLQDYTILEQNTFMLPQYRSEQEALVWNIYVLEKNGWRKTNGNTKVGKQVSYTFTQRSLNRKGIKIVVEQKGKKGELMIKPQPAKKPKILKVELLDINGNKVDKPLSYMDTLVAKAHCADMEGEQVYFTLWEDDAVGKGHHSDNEVNKINPIAIPSIVKKGVAEVRFPMAQYYLASKIANIQAPKGSKDEGAHHEYYVTVEYRGKSTNQNKASNNVNLKNPEYQKGVDDKIKESKVSLPSPSSPSKKDTYQLPLRPNSLPKSSDPKGKILKVSFRDKEGNLLERINRAEGFIARIETQNLVGQSLKLIVWEDDIIADQKVWEESIKVTNDVIEKPIKITQEMWRKGDDFKEFKDQEYYLEVSYASEIVQSKVVEVKDNAPTTKPETGKSMSKVAQQGKEQTKEETKCICKQYDLIWGRKIGCKERKKVVEVCKNIWGEEQKIEKANMLMAIMHLETAGTFSPSADNKKGYVGLIQFSGSTARGLGTTSENLKKMTFVEQMNYVEKYLRQNKDKMKTLEDFYLQVMKPSAVGNGSNPNFVIFDESIPIPDVDGKNTTEEQRKINITKEPWATKYGYSSNPSFMKEKDEKKLRKKWVYSRQRFEDRYGFEGGKTYVWEITEEIRPKHYDKGQNHKFVGECVEKEKEEKKVGNGRAPWMETAMEEYSMYKEYREKDDPLNNRIKEYHNTTSLKPLKKSSPQYDGKTPWCSSFVNFVMETSGYGGTNSARAYSWKKYGKEIKKPVYGAIAVCNWSHVAFVVGKNKIGNIVLLGGNQGGDFPDGKKAGCQRLCYTSGPANKMRFYIPLDYEVSSEELEILEVNNISDYESSR